MKFEVYIPDRFIDEFIKVANTKRAFHYWDDADGKRHREFKTLDLREPWHAVIEMINSRLTQVSIGLGETDQISVRRLKDDS